MAKKAGPWRGIVKWIVVPASLAGIGYAFVGPRIGGPLAEKAAEHLKSAPLPDEVASLVRRKPVAMPSTPTEPEKSPEPADTEPKVIDTPAPVATEPQIEVKVRRAESVVPVPSARRGLRAEPGAYPDLIDPAAPEPPKRKRKRTRKSAAKPETNKPAPAAPATDPASTPFPESVPPIDPASGPGNGTTGGGDPASGGTTGL